MWPPPSTVVLILAALGVVHLFSPRGEPGNNIVHKEAQVSATTSKAQPPPSAGEAVSQERLLEITEVTPRKTKAARWLDERNGQDWSSTRGRARKKGEVEIRVFFFDVTRDNEIRPTEAQVGI